MKKQLVTLLASGLVLAGALGATGLSGTGQAAAAPLQQLNTNGNTFGTFGDHSYCRGAITYTVDAPPKKRGVVRVTATSHGFTGDGPTWKRNPKCRILFGANFTSVRGVAVESWKFASFGPRPGEKKTFDVVTGSGPVSFGVATYSATSAIRVGQGIGPGFLLLVP